MNGIVDNTVFRLEKNVPNLGSQILSRWRRQVAIDWERKYHVQVAGFETFVIENERRNGSLYKADNWTLVGETQGSTKFHLHGIEKNFERVQTEKKMVFCKWIKGRKLPTEYIPVWNTPQQCRGQTTIYDFIREME